MLEGTHAMAIPVHKYYNCRQPIQFAALFLLFSLAFFAGIKAEAADLKVCKTCAYPTITAAVKAAKPYDRILVQKGYYPESNIEIKKPLQLIGIGKPVIDAKNK